MKEEGVVEERKTSISLKPQKVSDFPFVGQRERYANDADHHVLSSERGRRHPRIGGRPEHIASSPTSQVKTVGLLSPKGQIKTVGLLVNHDEGTDFRLNAVMD